MNLCMYLLFFLFYDLNHDEPNQHDDLDYHGSYEQATMLL